MSKKNKITITIKGGGLSYKGEIDEATAGQIISQCLVVQNNLKTIKGSVIPKDNLGRIKESVTEYLDRYVPRRNPDKILTVAGYLKNIEGKDSFHPNEIKNLFREAAEILPGNFSRDLRWVKKNGWIAEDSKKKGNYYVTNTGLKVLEKGFPEEIIKKSKIRTSGRHKIK